MWPKKVFYILNGAQFHDRMQIYLSTGLSRASKVLNGSLVCLVYVYTRSSACLRTVLELHIFFSICSSIHSLFAIFWNWEQSNQWISCSKNSKEVNEVLCKERNIQLNTHTSGNVSFPTRHVKMLLLEGEGKIHTQYWTDKWKKKRLETFHRFDYISSYILNNK